MFPGHFRADFFKIDDLGRFDSIWDDLGIGIDPDVVATPPDFVEAGFGFPRPRQYGSLKFQPEWQELLPVYDPQPSQPYVFGSRPPGVGGAFIFSFF